MILPLGHDSEIFCEAHKLNTLLNVNKMTTMCAGDLWKDSRR